MSVRQANYSAFNGGRRTPSAYSQLVCMRCRRTWRTKANYVARTPTMTAQEWAAKPLPEFGGGTRNETTQE